MVVRQKFFELSILLFVFSVCHNLYGQHGCCTNLHSAKDLPDKHDLLAACKEYGVIFFIPKRIYERILDRQSLGAPCQHRAYQFVVPFTQYNAILDFLENENNKVGALQELLGTKNWSGPVICIKVDASCFREMLEIRLPDPTDCGIDPDLFRIGGLTPGGCCEAYIHQMIPKSCCEVLAEIR